MEDSFLELTLFGGKKIIINVRNIDSLQKWEKDNNMTEININELRYIVKESYEKIINYLVVRNLRG